MENTIEKLTPEQVAQKLRTLIDNGTINAKTLVVWDIDDTLIRAGSDYTPRGAIAMSPEFSKIIAETQKIGTVHIALTNASPYDNTLEFKKNNLELAYEPQVTERGIAPNYFQARLNAGEPPTYEALRIAGLKHIGIDFTNPDMQKLPRSLGTIQFPYDLKESPEGNELLPIISKYGRPIATWVDETDRKQYQYIQQDAPLPGFEPDDYPKRHFILGHDTLTEIICNPIFSGGIIFCNFLSIYTQYYYGYIKGIVLRSFLEQCEGIRTFSNVVFIDDILDCVENVVNFMASMGMPCIGINIVSSVD